MGRGSGEVVTGSAFTFEVIDGDGSEQASATPVDEDCGFVRAEVLQELARIIDEGVQTPPEGFGFKPNYAEKREFLAQSLPGVTPNALSQFADRALVKSVGGRVIQSGQPHRYLFFPLVSTEVGFSRDDSGTYAKTVKLNPGDTFGEGVFLGGRAISNVDILGAEVPVLGLPRVAMHNVGAQSQMAVLAKLMMKYADVLVDLNGRGQWHVGRPTPKDDKIAADIARLLYAFGQVPSDSRLTRFAGLNASKFEFKPGEVVLYRGKVDLYNPAVERTWDSRPVAALEAYSPHFGVLGQAAAFGAPPTVDVWVRDGSEIQVFNVNRFTGVPEAAQDAQLRLARQLAASFVQTVGEQAKYV